MESINAAEFRQRCLAMLEHLPPEGLLITKHGRPVARIVPVRSNPKSFLGAIPDLMVNPKDDLFSTEEKWDAES